MANWKGKETAEEMKYPKTLPVLDDKFKINVDAFKTVLDKVGNRKFVLYSINGATRTGKSYVLNYFIKYFEYKKQNNLETADWTNFHLDSVFISRAGRERVTYGINLWSEPYILPTGNGEELAIILMDTQGLFDEHTTAFQNAFIMTISTLCSSVMIFNTMRLLNEDILQQIELYSNYASTVMDQDEELTAVVTVDENSDISVDLETIKCKSSCQNLLFLIRDFELHDYGFGIHDENTQPKESSKNYFQDTFGAPGQDSCPEENNLVRSHILNNFSQVSIYTLPDPGKEFKRRVEGDHVEPDQDFKRCLQEFIEFLASEVNLVRKSFDEVEVTGTEFLEYITRWAKECENGANKNFPAVHTTTESLAWTQYSITYNMSFTLYKQRINEFMSANKTGVSLSKLTECQLALAESALNMFHSTKKIENFHLASQLENKLASEMFSYFNVLTDLNQKRLDLQKWRPCSGKTAPDSEIRNKGSSDRIDSLADRETEHSKNNTFESGDSLRVKIGLKDSMDQVSVKFNKAEEATLQHDAEINRQCFLCYKERMDQYLSVQINRAPQGQHILLNFEIANTNSFESAIEMYKTLRKFPHTKRDQAFKKYMRKDICKYFKEISVRLIFAAAINDFNDDLNISDFHIDVSPCSKDCTDTEIAGDYASKSVFQQAWLLVVNNFKILSDIWP